MDNPTNQPETEPSDKPEVTEKPKVRKEISVVSVPHDNDVMAAEMAEMFDEDRVTHQHGSSEPEAD